MDRVTKMRIALVRLKYKGLIDYVLRKASSAGLCTDEPQKILQNASEEKDKTNNHQCLALPYLHNFLNLEHDFQKTIESPFCREILLQVQALNDVLQKYRPYL